jgi:hypothetical protein
MFLGGAAVAIGPAKMLGDTMAGCVEEGTTDARDVADIKEVGFEMELVRRGTFVARPWVSRLVWSEPVVSGFLPVRLGRICTVPDGLTLVETLWVEVLLTLTTDFGVELRVKLGRRAMIGREVLCFRVEGLLRGNVVVVVAFVVMVAFVVEVGALRLLVLVLLEVLLLEALR